MVELYEYEKAFKLLYKVFPKLVRWTYKTLPDVRVPNKCTYPLGAVSILGIYMFLFRFRSLLSFTEEFKDNSAALSNLRKYFTISGVPSDDEVRYILSTIPTKAINKLLQKIHQRLERMKLLVRLKFMLKYYLVSVDGTGQLSSYKIKCPKCLTRTNSKGETLYLHGQLVASLIDPKAQVSLTMAYEPIENNGVLTKYDKNDCELSASRRLFGRMKALYPKRKFCIAGDNLLAVTTVVNRILDFGWHFILTAKPERNQELFSWYDSIPEKKRSFKFTDPQAHTHEYIWSNKLPLKQEKKDKDHLYVNLLEYSEFDKEQNLIYYNTWITDFIIHEGNIKDIAQGGRARFAIENRTFNEQKTRGYQTEHNFGHFGNLPSVFFGLAQIAHIFSQIFSLWSTGKRLTKKVGSQRRFWERFATLYTSIRLPDDGLPLLYIKLEMDSS